MSIFSKKKKEGNITSCCDSKNYTPDAMKEVEKKKNESGIKILGSGCSKCNALEAATMEALKTLNMNVEVDHVTDFAQIASSGVMSTPALVINGKVVSYGKVLKVDEIIGILKKV